MCAAMAITKVIDQNYLREPNDKLHAFLSKGNYVVLTDYTCMEAYKGTSVVNLKRSCDIISKYPNQVLVLKNTLKIIKLSQHGTKCLRKRMIDSNQTRAFAKFFEQLYYRTTSEFSLQSMSIALKGVVANTFFVNNISSAKSVLAAIDLYKESFSQAQLKQLRNGVYDDALIDAIIKNIMTAAAMLMRKCGFFISELAKAKDNYLFRYSAAGFILVIKWLSEGGYQSIHATNFQNDMIDIICVAYGTYFDGVLSNDKKINEIYDVTSSFMKITEPNNRLNTDAGLTWSDFWLGFVARAG
jgi:hypothetical protein